MNNEEKDIETKQYLAENPGEEKTIEAIKRVVNQDESVAESETLTLKSFLGGDILQHSMTKKMILFIMFVVGLTLIYTGNTYVSQQKQIEEDTLRNQLLEEQYKVLTQRSVLLSESSLAKVEEMLKQNGDTALLKNASQPIIVE